MKKISLIIINTLILFIIVNAAVVFLWPVYSNLKSNKHNYKIEQINLLNMENDDLVLLYNETWRNYDKFKFVPFTGHSEKNREGKFVNFTEENGRKVNRPNSCKKYIYLYGGSTTFGYNVTDEQTIGQYIQNFLNDEYCIYNHGRAYYYSKQENHLFFLHIENKKKIDYAIFLDGINERCGGYEYQNQINNSFSLLVEKPYLMWKSSLKRFFLTLPIVQLNNSLFGKGRWIHDEENNILIIDSCKNKVPLEELFEKRIVQREAVCTEFKIKCFSFLQPMAGVHGVQIDELLNEGLTSSLKEKYNKLSKTKKAIDIGYVLDKDSKLSYIDAVHYSPLTNKKIAKTLINYLNLN